MLFIASIMAKRPAADDCRPRSTDVSRMLLPISMEPESHILLSSALDSEVLGNTYVFSLTWQIFLSR